MKITFLGTSAGESYPAIWCDCENCTYARQHGGRNIRMNTGTMIDSDILMDMNSCGFYTAARLGVSLTGVRHLLVTHPHADHLTIEPLEWRRTFGNAQRLTGDARLRAISPRFTDLPMMTVYGNRFTEEKLLGVHPEWFNGTAGTQMRFERITEGVRTIAGGDLAFTPVRSRHGQPGFAHSYILERGGKTLLYALDTSGYDPDMLEIILKKPLRRRGDGGHVRLKSRRKRRAHDEGAQHHVSENADRARVHSGGNAVFLNAPLSALDAAV